MRKNVKKVLWLIIGIIIGTSVVVGATTIFRSEDITYSSPTNKTNVKDSLDELYSKVGQCPEGKWCYNEPKTLADKVEIGDYISMVPTSTSYKISKDLTGYSEDQTINPSELNLWRVISKQAEGTVELTSEYVMSEEISFSGKVGYLNYGYTMQLIAEAYTIQKYKENTTMIGYSGQKWKCEALEGCEKTTKPYMTDLNTIKAALGTYVGKDRSGVDTRYCINTRMKNESNVIYGVGIVLETGEIGFWQLYKGDGTSLVNKCSLRPRIVIRADVNIESGDGKTAETAYTFK